MDTSLRHWTSNTEIVGLVYATTEQSFHRRVLSMFQNSLNIAGHSDRAEINTNEYTISILF